MRTRQLPPSRDWTKGSIPGNLWALSWPALVTGLVNTLGPAVDMFWVGKLGAASIAGVGVSGMVVMVMTSLMMGVFTGTQALIARSIGANDEKTANRAAQQAFVIAAALSVFMAAIGIFFAVPILTALGVAPDVIADGAAYMRIQLIGMVTMGSVTVGQSIMQATGDARTPMKISVAYRLFHVAFVPVLVLGLLGFPRLGVSGAALSNVISQSIGGAIGLAWLFGGHTRLTLTLRNFRFDRSLIWRTVKIGVPASITHMERSFGDLVLAWLIIPFGTLFIAAHSLAQRLDQFIMTSCAGTGTASGVLAAQSLGAGLPQRAARTGWLAAGLATSLSTLAAIAIWVWAEAFIRLFNPDPQLVEIASAFLRIQAVGYLFWGVTIAFSMCLNVVGATTVPMLTNLITMWGVQLTLAVLLSQLTGLEAYGVRWAIVAGIVLRAVIYTVYFARGTWQRKRV